MERFSQTDTISRAVIRDGVALCPRCWKKLCRTTNGGSARGIILWCRKCKCPVLLEIE